MTTLLPSLVALCERGVRLGAVPEFF